MKNLLLRAMLVRPVKSDGPQDGNKVYEAALVYIQVIPLTPESELTVCCWEHHGLQLTCTQALDTSSRAKGSGKA